SERISQLSESYFSISTQKCSTCYKTCNMANFPSLLPSSAVPADWFIPHHSSSHQWNTAAPEAPTHTGTWSTETTSDKPCKRSW
ncbi:hypothetical protein XENOCAPTIV_008742, partial [Xenoophorus captivus]